ncbi:hypothetical protein [Thiocystis violascens]|uniref:Outer membrane protein n=1 Tax=Thiocystis violascens (strain ATCC 17096 / DSM 198 / 6111) TaxID=765911 RepID=I3YBF4_THIV6|nr:hypothetical protein [Thiocystis violascens]AFL74322.1 hypothetical protein Thivi_2377 [Thiocystis violascens DSM 198]
MRLSISVSSLTIAMLVLALTEPVTRVAWAVSDPLSLAQSLTTLAAHPRMTASADLEARLPRRQPLYLDCDGLAFNHSLFDDPNRNQPLAALLSPLAAQQLEVMARFFDVLLADLRFASESEAMAVAYIQFDRASVRRQLGQVSELRVLELETVYQDLLHRRAASEIGQQWSRSLLAQALGQPEDVPRNLTEPILPTLPHELPTLDALLAGAADAPTARALGQDRPESERALIRMELRQQILELLLRLKALAAAEQSVRTESTWRDLKLDESRTLYDQEVTADLGYSMSQQTQTRLLEKRLAYCQALTWAELNALADQPLWALTPRDEP